MDIDKIFIEKILFPAMEIKNGNKIRKYCKGMKSSQYLSRDQLLKLQNEKLKKLLLTCIKNVKAYQQYDKLINDIEENPFEVLKKIPILNKDEFRKHSENYLNTKFDKNKLIPNSTGGSTGLPLKFYMDRFDVEHSEAARWRGLSWFDISYGSRSVMFWGNPIELSCREQKRGLIRDKVLKNRKLISAYDLSKEKLDKHISFLNKYQPEYFYGYASAINTFCELLLAHKKDALKLKKLKAVVTTAETLHEYQRENIKKALGCAVVNEYGARDAGILAYECKFGHMHISAENVLVEIVDPITHTPLPEGESGLVVVTDLNNFAMPRLRYLLGDTATLSKEVCPCGITLPLIQSLDGREDAMFKLPNGSLVHGHFIYHYASKYNSIMQFQLVQKDIYNAELNIVLRDDEQGEVDDFICDLTQILIGVKIYVNIVKNIPVSASGKVRYAIREFDL